MIAPEEALRGTALQLAAWLAEMHVEGDDSTYFVRTGLTRWVVPVDDTNSKMIGWRVMGPGIDTRGIATTAKFAITSPS